MADSQKAYLHGTIEFYQARTNTKMTVAAERLAVIAAVTLPITALSSVLGMNVIVNQQTHWIALTVTAGGDAGHVDDAADLGEAQGLVLDGGSAFVVGTASGASLTMWIKTNHRVCSGAIIREQRELAALPMRQLAKSVGISNPYLSQIERGLRAPSEAVVEALAASLDLSVDELYRRAGFVEPETVRLTTTPIRSSRRRSRPHPNSRPPSAARCRRSTEVSSTPTAYAERRETTTPTDQGGERCTW